jgi:homoserine trans-succinylase
VSKPIKVIWVDSWRDIKPCEDRDSTLRGYADNERRCVYAIKDVSPEYVVEHEKYHVRKNHPEYPRDYRDYIRMELEANKHTYDLYGKPRHILSKLKAIFNDIMRRKSYRATPKQIVGAIESSLHSVDAPKAWFADFRKLKVEVRRAGGDI